MSNDTWFGKKGVGSDMAINGDEILIGVGTPDYVRTPPELGGQRVKVISAFMNSCPRCDAQVKHLELENGLFVAECLTHYFLWYRRKSSPDR